MQERRVKITKELAEEMKTMDRNAFWNKGEDIAVEDGYYPAGYSFDNPRLEESNGQWYFCWRCFASCH